MDEEDLEDIGVRGWVYLTCLVLAVLVGLLFFGWIFYLAVRGKQ